jgi:hypothetical protein
MNNLEQHVEEVVVKLHKSFQHKFQSGMPDMTPLAREWITPTALLNASDTKQIMKRLISRDDEPNLVLCYQSLFILMKSVHIQDQLLKNVDALLAAYPEFSTLPDTEKTCLLEYHNLMIGGVAIFGACKGLLMDAIGTLTSHHTNGQVFKTGGGATPACKRRVTIYENCGGAPARILTKPRRSTKNPRDLDSDASVGSKRTRDSEGGRSRCCQCTCGSCGAVFDNSNNTDMHYDDRGVEQFLQFPTATATISVTASFPTGTFMDAWPFANNNFEQLAIGGINHLQPIQAHEVDENFALIDFSAKSV